jgi:histidine ammonia-lyase
MNCITLDGNSLTLEQVWNIANENTRVTLSEDACNRVNRCRAFVEQIISEGRTVYGLTTGFGKFSTISIPVEQIDELQENLILSHATGVGKFLPEPETRAILLLRINVLAKGHSGIRLQTLQTLIDMLNAGVHPCIPEKGSVGASGDLAPLSHLALVLLGKGQAYYKGELLEGGIAMQKAGIQPVKLAAKEGLALNNGTQVMTGIGVLALMRAENLARVADISAALTLDALQGTPAAYDPLIHRLRPHSGQMQSADNLYRLIMNSRIRESHLHCSNVQDPYSVRCTPQVHGAVREALQYVRGILNTEINSATDNPLIFPEEERVISGGNFHGEPVAIAMDTLGIAAAELANIAERRIEQMYNPALNRGLKPFLAPRPGLDSGFMIAQLTAASLVSENKVWAHPASVHSIPSSANQEDHVSMGTIGAVKAKTIIDNVSYVIGIELMSSCQALDERAMSSSPVLEAVKTYIRQSVAHLDRDRVIYPDIQFLRELADSRQLPDLVASFMLLH